MREPRGCPAAPCTLVRLLESAKMSKSRYAAVLFDLDGTLSDPLEGIVRSTAYALEQTGHQPPHVDALRDWIGPPLRSSFLSYLGDEGLADRAVEAYRERYLRVGMYENTLYPDIPELLAELRAAGTRLFVATSKIRVPTEGILAHFDLARYFEAVAAPDPSDHGHKAEVIGTLLPQLGADRARSVMVGDTTFDIEGARAHGLPCIAVSYGYGPPERLRAAEPFAIVDSVPALRELLLS